MWSWHMREMLVNSRKCNKMHSLKTTIVKLETWIIHVRNCYPCYPHMGDASAVKDPRSGSDCNCLGKV